VPFPMQRIDQLSGGREPFCRGNILWCWTHCGQMAPLGARPRLVCAHGPALTRMTQTRADELPSPQDIYNELKPLLGNHCGRPAGHHGEGWPAATRRRRWRSALTIATARRREPRCATEATDVRPIVMPSAKRFGAPSASLGSSCMCIQKNCRKRNVSLVFLSAARASVI
jgi:hypothetical protein